MHIWTLLLSRISIWYDPGLRWHFAIALGPKMKILVASALIPVVSTGELGRELIGQRKGAG